MKEELCESEEDSLVEEDFDLKENSFLLMKTQRTYSNIMRTKTEQETGQIIILFHELVLDISEIVGSQRGA